MYVCRLTDDGQVQPGVARGRLPEVHATPVHAGVHFGHVVDGQHGRFGDHSEMRPALQRVVLPVWLVRVHESVPDVHTV